MAKRPFRVNIKEIKRQDVLNGHSLIILNLGWLCVLGGNSSFLLRTQLFSLESGRGKVGSGVGRGAGLLTVD